MTSVTVLDLVQARAGEERRVLVAAAAVVLGSLLVAASSQVQMFVPGLPAPVTLQTLAVLLLGLLLGPRLGAAAALLFVFETLAFPSLLASGRFLVTGGYVLGFVPAAWIAGALYRLGWGRSLLRALVAVVPANLVILLCGAWWLAAFQLPAGEAFAKGFLAFLPLDLVKIALCAPMMRGVAWAADRLQDRL